MTVSLQREHGTNSCYQSGCRRPECRRAHAAYERIAWLRREHPDIYGIGDQDALRKVILQVTTPLIDRRELADTSGVSRRSLYDFLERGHSLLWGNYAKVRRGLLDMLEDADTGDPA